MASDPPPIARRLALGVPIAMRLALAFALLLAVLAASSPSR
jgi:hypothetical protein